MNMKMIARLYNMAMNGGMDGLAAPLGVLVDTLALYPARRPMATPEDVERFLVDDEKLRASLTRAIGVLAELPIWQNDEIDEDEAADLADNCRAGLDAWFDDQRSALERHPGYTSEGEQRAKSAAAEALRQKGVELQSAAAPPKRQKGKPSQPPAAADPTVCECGKPATTEFVGYPICAQCLAAAHEYAAELLSKGGAA